MSYTEPPSVPVGLTLTEQQTSITVHWSSPAETGGRSDLYYQVEHSDPDNLGTYIGTDYVSGTSTRRKVFSGLRPYTQYCIRVIAHNGVSDQDPDGTHLRTVEECTRTREGREFAQYLRECIATAILFPSIYLPNNSNSSTTSSQYCDWSAGTISICIVEFSSAA